METPRKPVKNKSAATKPGAVKKTAPSTAAKPKSKFLDDDDDDEFDAPIDDMGSFDHLDGLEDDDDY